MNKTLKSIEELKIEAGKIPENTCPLIDKCLEEVNNLLKSIDYISSPRRRYETPEEVLSDLPNSWLDTPELLEKLRVQNEQLRNLGKFWYEQYCEVRSLLPLTDNE